MQRQKSIKPISGPVLWMAGGAILVLLGLIGLAVLEPISYKLPEPKLILSFILQLSFGLGWATLTIAFNCWLNLKLSRGIQIPRQSYAGQNNPILPWPEQQTTIHEQFG